MRSFPPDESCTTVAPVGAASEREETRGGHCWPIRLCQSPSSSLSHVDLFGGQQPRLSSLLLRLFFPSLPFFPPLHSERKNYLLSRSHFLIYKRYKVVKRVDST